MKAVLTGLMALVLAGCSTIPDYQTGDFNIRTSQIMGEDTLKVYPIPKNGQPLQDGKVNVTTRTGDSVLKKNIRRGHAIIQYPMHESSVVIEISDETGRTGSRLFFRSQLREIPPF